MIKPPITIALLLLILVSNSFAYDLIESRSIGMGRTVLLSDPSATDLVNIACPSRDSLANQVETGYNRRFELSELDHLFIAGVYNRKQVTVAFAASQFGKSELYAEQLLKGMLTYHHRLLSVAASLSALQVQIGNDYGTLRIATLGLSASWSNPKFLVSLAADNLTRPTLVQNAIPTTRNLTLLSEYRGPGSYSITGRLHIIYGQKPQFGLGQLIRLSGKSSFFWGIGTAPLEYGGGIAVDIPIGSLSYATSVHPVLGFSHTVALTWKPSASKPDEDDF